MLSLCQEDYLVRKKKKKIRFEICKVQAIIDVFSLKKYI